MIGVAILGLTVRNNGVPIAAGLIVLILIGGALSVWFLNNFEYVPEQVRGDMGAEARRNSLLAAERYLSHLGISTISQAGRQLLVEPPPQRGLLLVRDLGPPLTQSRVASLLAWVEQGGTLVVTPGNAVEEGSGHPLLEKFAVIVESDELFEAEAAGSVILPWSEDSLQIAFDSDKWFSVDNERSYFASPDDGFSHLVRFPWGEGSVTFLSDSEIGRAHV